MFLTCVTASTKPKPNLKQDHGFVCKPLYIKSFCCFETVLFNVGYGTLKYYVVFKDCLKSNSLSLNFFLLRYKNLGLHP